MLPIPPLSFTGGASKSGDVAVGPTVFNPAFGGFAVGGKGNTASGGTTSANAEGSPVSKWLWLAVAGVGLLGGAWLLLRKK